MKEEWVEASGPMQSSKRCFSSSSGGSAEKARTDADWTDELTTNSTQLERRSDTATVLLCIRKLSLPEADGSKRISQKPFDEEHNEAPDFRNSMLAMATGVLVVREPIKIGASCRDFSQDLKIQRGLR